MSEAKHTPGPWKYVDASKAASYQYKSLCVIEAGDKQVASFSWNDNSKWFPTKSESQANARLIAAAPDLLDALRECLLEHGGFTIRGECERRARAAISKATGAAP